MHSVAMKVCQKGKRKNMPAKDFLKCCSNVSGEQHFTRSFTIFSHVLRVRRAYCTRSLLREQHRAFGVFDDRLDGDVFFAGAAFAVFAEHDQIDAVFLR
jgi:hypothetical protein